jgi:hypothetical protein
MRLLWAMLAGGSLAQSAAISSSFLRLSIFPWTVVQDRLVGRLRRPRPSAVLRDPTRSARGRCRKPLGFCHLSIRFLQRDKLNSEINKIFEGFEKNPPINSVEVQKIANAINFELPSDYLEIFSFMNGGEGFIGNEYCRLYPLEELIPLNESFSVKEVAPSIFVFGSNGGGEAFAFNTTASSVSIVKIPFIPMDIGFAELLGKTFGDFLASFTKNSNSGSSEINKDLIGKEIHEIQPIVFGGSPTDPKNKAFVPVKDYGKLVVFWNKIWQGKKEGVA